MGLCGAFNSWFESYLNNRKQLVSINGVNLWNWRHGVPQGLVLGPLLFLISITQSYIVDLYHFADDAHLINISNSPKEVQKQLNIDLNCLYNWLLANKISLNSKMIIFQKRGSKLNWKWNVRLNGYKLTLSDVIKYLGMYLDKFIDGLYQLQ